MYELYSRILISSSRPTGGAPGVFPQDFAFRISRNGRLPATLPEPIKRARDKDLCGLAGEGNVAERSERMRAKRSPTSPDLFSGSNRFKRGVRAGLLREVRKVFHTFARRRPEARRGDGILSY